MKTRPNAKARKRDPEATRENLLQCAFQEIWEHGYAGASLDRILAKSGVTKGALYHHFGSKADLAVAVIDEVIRPFVLSRWVEPLEGSDDPITALETLAAEVPAGFTSQEMCCGCPLNNLVQELSNAGEEFRAHLGTVFDAWRRGLTEAFAHGQETGHVRPDVDPKAVAAFIVATVQGLATTMKSTQDLEVAGAATTMLVRFLETLRPDEAAAPAA